MTTPTPDPERLGGIAWLQRTRGSLTRSEKRSLLGIIARTQGQNMVGRLRLATGRVPDQVAGIDDALLDPPDSALAREAEEAGREQPAAGPDRRCPHRPRGRWCLWNVTSVS